MNQNSTITWLFIACSSRMHPPVLRERSCPHSVDMPTSWHVAFVPSLWEKKYGFRFLLLIGNASDMGIADYKV